MQAFFVRLFNFLFWFIGGIRRRLIKKSTARKFSNRVLKEYLRYLEGDIINVSGWEDADKEGGHYRDYYKAVSSYTISNIEGEHGMPKKKDLSVEWCFLDLEQPLKKEFFGKFDIVFNHTVLEHVYRIETALENLAAMTKDVLVLIVPFVQGVHDTSSYGDYYRVTPLYLKKNLTEKGFSILLMESNCQPFNNIYLVCIASRFPEKHIEFASATRHFGCRVFPAKFGIYEIECNNDE